MRDGSERTGAMEMSDKMKTPEELSAELVELGMRMEPSHGFDNMRDRMQAFVAQAIRSERECLNWALEVVKERDWILNENRRALGEAVMIGATWHRDEMRKRWSTHSPRRVPEGE